MATNSDQQADVVLETASDWADDQESGSTGSRRGFFTAWRCCGCLGIVGAMVLIGTLIAFRWAVNSVFMPQAIEVPALSFTDTEADEIRQRIEEPFKAGELVELTPRELSILFLAAPRNPEAKTAGPESVFSCSATPDGLLDLRFGIQVPTDDTQTWPFFAPPGHFINLKLVGLIAIEKGQVTEAKLEEFKFGDIWHQENIDNQSSKQIVDGIRAQRRTNPELRSAMGAIEVFKFDGEKIQIQIIPE